MVKMQMYYSLETGGFYSSVIHGEKIPMDAVALSTEEYGKLLEALNAGKIANLIDGKIILLDPPAPPPPTQEQQEVARQSAYTTEADPLFFEWQAGEATKEEWEAKRQEIRARYPYPEE
jgi:hypothetical protein